MKRKSFGPITLARLSDQHLDDWKMDALIKMLQYRLVWRRFVRAGYSLANAAEWADYPMDVEKAEQAVRSEALRRTK